MLNKWLVVWNVLITAFVVLVFMGSCSFGGSEWVNEVNINRESIKSLSDEINVNREVIREHAASLKKLSDWVVDDLDDYIKAVMAATP